MRIVQYIILRVLSELELIKIDKIRGFLEKETLCILCRKSCFKSTYEIILNSMQATYSDFHRVKISINYTY